MSDVETICEGRFLRLVKRGRWEYATRKTATGVVAIVALTPDDKVIIVEQSRPPAGGRVIELPAGLAGDEGNDELLVTAARRELQEETGYVAESWTRLTCGLSSSGLTDEAVTFFLAEGLTRAGAGGGVDGEAITVHEVAFEQVADWLAVQVGEGAQFDLKLLAGLYAAQPWRSRKHDSQ